MAISTIGPSGLNDTIVSGKTALAAEPADTDEFLVSDAGTIKRIDYSLIKASNTPAFSVKLSGNQEIANATWTKVTLSAEDYDTDSAFESNKFTVPSGKAGKYFFHYNLGSAAALDDGERLLGALYKNGSKLSEYSTSNDRSPTADVDNFINNSITLALDEDDYIELYVYHSEGAAMNVLANSCLLQGHRLIGA